MSDTATKPKPKKTRKANVGSDPTKGSLVKLWQVGLYIFAIGASLILLIVNVGILAGGGFSYIMLVVALLVIGLSWSLLSSGDDGSYVEPAGLNIANSEPALVDFVASVASEVAAPMPDAIHLVTEAELELTEKSRYLGLKVDSSTLVLGLPYLHGLSRQEFAAVLAHELGHNGETGVSEGPRALRTLKAAQGLIAQERQGFVNAVYGSYARKVFRSIGGVGAAHEHAADRAAIEAYGSDAMQSALAKHDDVVAANDQLLRDYVVPALQNKVHPRDMFAGFDELLTSPARAEARARAVSRRRDKARSEFELHRTSVERMEEIEADASIPARVTVAQGGVAAHTLLDNDAKSAEIVVGTWASGLMGSTTEPRTWQELAAEIYSSESHTIASAGFEAEDDAEPADRFTQALSWAGVQDFEQLDVRLGALAVGDAECTPHDRRSVWAKNVVLEAAASQPSHHWQHDWHGQPQLVNERGQVFDPTAIAALLLAGDADQARNEFDTVTG